MDTDFLCPACGGRHFGRDVSARLDVLATVECHDEHRVGCRWRGLWPQEADEPVTIEDSPAR